MNALLAVGRAQAIAHRLQVNNLVERLPAKAYDQAARFALQDTVPRSALVSLHARVADCEPTAWEDERLIQTYSPRGAVHVLPMADWAVFTLGRQPSDPDERRAIDHEAKRVLDALGPGEHRSRDVPGDLGRAVRHAAVSGRIAIRWDASMVWFREVPSPADDDFEDARLELCRRHVHAFGPTTPAAFASWAGIKSVPDAKATWRRLAGELMEVSLEGHQAWILKGDEPALVAAELPHGVRLLPMEEGRLFGADKTGLFVAPQRKTDWSTSDNHHPHHVIVDGEVAGRWGRRAGRVVVKLWRPPTSSGVGEPMSMSDVYAAADAALLESIEKEALSMPIPNAHMQVEIISA